MISVDYINSCDDAYAANIYPIKLIVLVAQTLYGLCLKMLEIIIMKKQRKHLINKLESNLFALV